MNSAVTEKQGSTWSKKGHSKVLETVAHVCMMMGITQKQEVGSNYVAEMEPEGGKSVGRCEGWGQS